MSHLYDTTKPQFITAESTIRFDEEKRWFEDFLASNNIPLSLDSPAKNALNSMDKISKLLSGKIHSLSEEDVVSLIRDMVGLPFLIRVLNRTVIGGVPDWLIERLKECLKAPLPFAQPEKRTPERDKLWELICACIIRPYCPSIEFAEPDIRASFQNIQWGVACKTLNSQDPDQQVRLIVEGGKQLEKSNAEYGCITIEASRLIDHSKYWQLHANLANTYSASEVGAMLIQGLFSELKAMIDRLAERQLFARLAKDSKTGRERRKTRSLLFLAQTVTSKNREPVSFSVLVIPRFRPMDWIEEKFAEQFSDHAYRTLIHQIPV